MLKNFNYICRINFKTDIMIQNIKEAKKFDKWLRHKIKNVHVNNNERMLNAYERIEALKYNPAS